MTSKTRSTMVASRPGAHVAELGVGLGCEVGDGVDGLVLELDVEPFDFEEGLLLCGERVFRFGEYADEVVPPQRGELDADGEPALEFGHEVGDAGLVEGAGGNKKDVVGVDDAVPRGDGGSLDDGEQVALDALA